MSAYSNVRFILSCFKESVYTNNFDFHWQSLHLFQNFIFVSIIILYLFFYSKLLQSILSMIFCNIFNEDNRFDYLYKEPCNTGIPDNYTEISSDDSVFGSMLFTCLPIVWTTRVRSRYHSHFFSVFPKSVIPLHITDILDIIKICQYSYRKI